MSDPDDIDECDEDARDLGSLDLPERDVEWQDEYADAVGIRRYGEL